MFKNVWEDFPDKLDSDKKYQFRNDNFFKTYCTNKCSSFIDKINAGCLYLFDEFFKNSSVFDSVAKNNVNIVEYIMIWLSYMLILKDNLKIKDINQFYDDFIIKDKYNEGITGIKDYNSYDDLMNKKKYLMEMDIKDISKFYDLFKLLCEIYNEFDEKTSNCEKCSQKANQFVEKYKEVNGDSSITKNSSYSKIFCTLSNDYDNFKKKYNESQCCKSSPLATIEENITINCSEQRSEVTSSSSSIASKLIPVLSIFGAIAIFWGISYKYSLFGFRKQFQKQKLREQIKK
ncbi:hypothetical protein YYC_02824 [Plasmodium yoelii 17X]|uniref:YIR protein n=1 Tax=Plasmodium yoelii 17X TaxID=1323249 RepID=V7PLZ7_PLAYE|nr:hypothetical protein YYC_02824 [Plasmodium yoelii 17X]